MAEIRFDKTAAGVSLRAHITARGTNQRFGFTTADMNEPRIRAATSAEVSVVRQIVEQVYRHYIARIGKPPGPMLDDYGGRVSDRAVWVIEEGTAIAGIIVILPKPDHLLFDYIAVAPAR